MPLPTPQTCPKCGRPSLMPTKSLRFDTGDGETSLRIVLECQACRRAVVREGEEAVVN